MRGKALAVKILVYGSVLVWLGGISFLFGYRIRYPQPDQAYARANRNPAPERAEAVQQPNSEPDDRHAENDQGYAAKWTEPIVVLTFLLLIVAAIAAAVYYGQLQKMRETVGLLVTQGATMEKQSAAAEWQAKMATEQVVALQSQERAMYSTVAHSERMAKAAEDNAKTAREALYIGEAPYFGISNMSISGWNERTRPRLNMTVVNGGKTPAWHFHVIAWLAVGNSPQTANRWHFQLENDHIGQTFAQANVGKPLAFVTPDLIVDTALQERVDREKLLIFIDGAIHYNDMRGEPFFYNFTALYDPTTDAVTDYTVGREATKRREI